MSHTISPSLVTRTRYLLSVFRFPCSVPRHVVSRHCQVQLTFLAASSDFQRSFDNIEISISLIILDTDICIAIVLNR